MVYQLEQASFELPKSILRFHGALLLIFGASVLLLVQTTSHPIFSDKAKKRNTTQLINLIWGLNFHIFEPEEPEGDEMYDTKIVVHQHQWFGPFPVTYKEIADQDIQEALVGIMSAVPPDKMKPFQCLNEREICNADKAFLLKIMKLDPRDRPTAKELLQDVWFTERSDRTVGWYSKEEWQLLQKQAGSV